MRAITLLLLLSSLSAWSQSERPSIRKGNSEYKTENFSNAEVAYTEALQKNEDSFEAKFNLGDALYKQNKFDKAAEQFQKLAESASDPQRIASINHNLGKKPVATDEIDVIWGN